MYEPRYLARNPFSRRPRTGGCRQPGHRALPIPARRTSPSPSAGRPRANRNPAPAVALAQNVLAPAWLTNAQGCVVYRGNAFPSNYLGNVFIADPSAHVIHRAVLREAGLDLTAVRAPDETNTEFVVSPDAGFCPTQIVNGPDGALYVADRQDGGERGRIYRIVPAELQAAQTAAARAGQDLRIWWRCSRTRTAGSATRRRGCFMSGRTRRPRRSWRTCSPAPACRWRASMRCRCWTVSAR